MPSQQHEPPPLPLDDEAFEDVPLLLREIEAAIAHASGNELKALRLMARHLQNVDKKTVQGYEQSRREFATLLHALGRRFDRLEKRFDVVDREMALTANDVSVTRALGEETVRHAQKIPRVLQTAEATLLAADGARVAAEAGVTQSQLTRSTLEILAEMRARSEPAAVTHEHEVAPSDIVSVEAADGNIIPIRQTRQSPLAKIAMVAAAVAVSMLSMSGVPYENAALPAEIDLPTPQR